MFDSSEDVDSALGIAKAHDKRPPKRKKHEHSGFVEHHESSPFTQPHLIVGASPRDALILHLFSAASSNSLLPSHSGVILFLG